MSNFNKLNETIAVMMWLGVVGLLAILDGGAWGLWWIWNHVTLVVK